MTGPPTNPFGAYQLVRWLSAGPDGVAYEALDSTGRELELRHVALGGDLARSPLAAFGVGSRTRRIALLSVLEHPHVLPVLDAGEHHVVLERSAGSWLDPALHPATPEAWIMALQSILQGLAAAH
ncbi:MAG: hypothetical protein K8H88_06165, partial [Sandaracinaceae bacterium]|nr:hypothetical protein [Sandaracinaceae bacterium]